MPAYPRDYYKILQVDPEADPEVIAAAYRRLSLKYHPDTNRAADATLRMQEINEAYEVLKDPAKRARYDHARPGYGHPDSGRRAEEHAPTAARPAPEPDVPGFHAFRNVPRGAKTVQAFAAEPVYCRGNPPQEHTLPGGCWIDLGFEWIAREVAIVTTTWRALDIAVTVDGVSVNRTQWQVKGPDAIALPGAQGPRYGYVVTDALYLPALPPGDHVITWTVRFTRDVDDGWSLHPRGSALVVTSLLHIGKDSRAR
jgi:hypothetical protein